MGIDELTQHYLDKGLTAEDAGELRELSKGDIAGFRRYLERRLLHEPMAYIRGNVTFFGRRFIIDRRVYVPNPETETMVKIFLEGISDVSVVLDVGTGSGCIAATVALERPGIRVYGSDISPDALKVARTNVDFYGVDVELYESYHVDDLPEVPDPSHIIANLPYGNLDYVLSSIDKREFPHMPAIAIFPPAGILAAYRELIASIQRKGWHSKLFFESGRVEKKKVAEIIPEGLGWEYRQFKDYSVSVVQL